MHENSNSSAKYPSKKVGIQNRNLSPEEIVEKGHWEVVIPWFLTLTSTALLIGIAWFLYENLIWLRHDSLVLHGSEDLEYRSHAYFLYVSSVRRSVGLFSGIALMLLGIGVSFYTIKTQTKLHIGGMEKFTVGLITASPGIIAMLLGVLLIVHNTSSKDKIPMYEKEKVETKKMLRDTPPL